MTAYTPEEIRVTCKEITNIEQVINAKLPSLKRLSRNSSEDEVKDIIRLHIVELDVFLKQKSGLSPEAIELLTDEIFNAYGHILSFADIYLIFRKAKLGRYGELYNQLSSMKIMQWFDAHIDDRLYTGAEMSRRADAEKFGYDDGWYRSR